MLEEWEKQKKEEEREREREKRIGRDGLGRSAKREPRP